jgi:hypothetical protein
MMAADDITVVVAQQPVVPMRTGGTEAMNTRHRRFERMEHPIRQLRTQQPRMLEVRDRAQPMPQHPMPALRTLARLML